MRSNPRLAAASSRTLPVLVATQGAISSTTCFGPWTAGGQMLSMGWRLCVYHHPGRRVAYLVPTPRRWEAAVGRGAHRGRDYST